MKGLEWLRRSGRQVRAWVWPFRSARHHYTQLARTTAKEIGVAQPAVELLARQTLAALEDMGVVRSSSDATRHASRNPEADS